MQWESRDTNGVWEDRFAYFPKRVGKRTVWWEPYRMRRVVVSKNAWDYEYRLQDGYVAVDRVTDHGWTDMDGAAVCAHEWIKK